MSFLAQKSYIPEICESVQKVDYPGTEAKSFLNEVGIRLNQCKFWFLDGALKRFKDSSEMATENTIPAVPWKLPTCTRNE